MHSVGAGPSNASTAPCPAKTRTTSGWLPSAARIKEYASFGAGPRASQYLVLGAKARAALAGRPVPELSDVKAIAIPVLAHRVVPHFRAEAANIKPADLVRTVIEGVKP